MGGYGGFNGYPFQYGGGKSEEESTYHALRAALGGDDARAIARRGTIEDEWIRAIAIGVAKANSGPEAAAMQAFPETASYHVDSWAERLGVEQQGEEELTRQANVVAWTTFIRADFPALEDAIEALSPFLSVYHPERAAQPVVHFGKAFTAGQPDREFVGLATQWPAFSGHYRLIIVWDHVASEVASPPAELRAELERFLNLTLPSWVDYRIQQHPSTTFYLDGGADGLSLLDATPLGPPP